MQSELARQLGCSRSALIRWGGFTGTSLDAHSYKPEVKRKVFAHYEKYGKIKTQGAFPDISVRSIVERNYGKFKPRQIRWTGKQLLEAVKMGGLISYRAQAKFFNRPFANEGSVKSLWLKRFGMLDGQINGMVHNHARRLIVGGSGYKYLRPMGNTRKYEPTKFRRIMLWVDIEKALDPNLPDFIKDSIRALADFQRWLWKSENPRPLILQMIKEREPA